MGQKSEKKANVQPFLHVRSLQIQYMPSGAVWILLSKNTSIFYSSTSSNDYLDSTRLDLTAEKVSIHDDTITFVRSTSKKKALLLMKVILTCCVSSR